MKWMIVLCTMWCIGTAQAQYDFEEEYLLNLAAGAEELRYFACDSTDFLVLKCKSSEKQNFAEFSFMSYEGDTVGMSTDASKAHHRLDIVRSGVYVLRLKNGATAGNYELYVHHEGDNSRTKKMGVQWLELHDTTWLEPTHAWVDSVIYRTEVIHKPQHFFLNSATNVMGRTRITLPVSLPANTESWYYTYSSYRDEAEAIRMSKTFDLAGELAGLLIGSGGKLIGKAASLLTSPSGGEQCDVYLLGEDQVQSFREKEDFTYKPEGSRENYASGTVEITKHKGDLHLGFRNNSMLSGIHVVVEVVAVTRTRERLKRTTRPFTVETRKIPSIAAQ